MPDPARYFGPYEPPAQERARAAPPAWAMRPDAGLFRFLGASVLRPIAELVFRVDVQGLEHLPERGPAIVVVNHSGATWLRDGALFLQRWAEHVGYDPARLPRACGLPRFFDVTPFAGATRPSTTAHIDAVLGEGGVVLWYPEDGADIAAHGAHRGPGSFLPDFVAAALRHDAAIVPVACHGSERFPWSTRDPFTRPEGPRFVVGAPLRMTIDRATASAEDRVGAAKELRRVIREMLHASRRPGPARWEREIGRMPGLFAPFLSRPGAPACGSEGASPVAPPAPADAGLARRVARLEAENEVSRAMFAWGRALDRVEQTHARADAVLIAEELMTADGVMDFGAVGWGVWGPDKAALVTEILAFSKRIGWSYHAYPNGEIDVDPERGTASFTTGTEMVPLVRDGAQQWFFLTQRTDFRKVDGAWKVARYTLRDLRVASSASDRW